MRFTKAEDGNDDDNASTEVQSDSFRVELTIEVFPNVKSMKEHRVDVEVSTVVGTETKIVMQRLIHWLVALQSISYSIGWTLPMTSKS